MAGRHIHLGGLATAIHEISGLSKKSSRMAYSWKHRHPTRSAGAKPVPEKTIGKMPSAL
jgi:hypothetical protein